MSGILLVSSEVPALLEFRGPDAVRFLNGQLTQDVRRVTAGKISLPSCVTDAKGKLQFRVTITATDEGALWIAAPENSAEALEARLTRYLIADDVGVADLTGNYVLYHFIGTMPEPPQGVMVRESNRYGVAGTDWWVPSARASEIPPHAVMSEEAREALRIANGVPAWGRELMEGMLPPEAALEETDISYNKGCYIGQEVISRIKSAGKVNRRLTRFIFDADIPVASGPLEDGAGEITSVSPVPIDGIRRALGYVKRGAGDLTCRTADGAVCHVRTA